MQLYRALRTATDAAERSRITGRIDELIEEARRAFTPTNVGSAHAPAGKKQP